jgi:UDP-N-acetyl-D-galactosamine dehydrogenase
MDTMTTSPKIAIIGLGYVGLPLAIAFGQKYATVGFDIHTKRVDELKEGKDHTLQSSSEAILNALQLSFLINYLPLKIVIFILLLCLHR